eukprot:jgi/Mesvir1/21460/Mv03916-RA.1
MSAGGRQALRVLLRAVNKNLVPDKAKTWKEYIKSQSRKSKHSGEELAVLAKEYAALLHHVHEHKNLLISYNISTDKDSGVYERIAKSAERVGLTVPPPANRPEGSHS